MSVFYLPIELSTRELAAKVFLANKIASMGGVVFLFRSDLFDAVGWPSSGIYIGKNMFRTEVPHDDKYYKEMKKKGIRVCHLDEEGGVYQGKAINDWEKRLELRFDPCSLDDNDYIFTWGNWQKKYYTEKVGFKNVFVTGSPNFDICQEKYKPFFESHDLSVTKGLDEFILINTRFSLSNSVKGYERFIDGSGPISKKIDREKIIKMISECGALQYQFVQLAIYISEKFPNEKIVLRPHPNEDIKFYTTLLSSFRNIYVIAEGDVGPWIRRCKLMVHNGCSTAIQADMAGKPVVSYQPINEQENNFSMGIPDKVGVKACKLHEVYSLINKFLNSQLPEKRYRAEWEESLSEPDSIDKLADVIEEIAKIEGNYTEVNSAKFNAKKKIRLFEFLESVKFFPRLAFGRSKAHSESIKSFNIDFFDTADSINESANNFYKSNVAVNRLGKYCYEFEKK